MANWKFTLDIHQVWNDKEMSIQDKGKAIAEEIKKMVPEKWIEDNNPNSNSSLDHELISILEWFSDLSSYHGHSIISEFDGIMEYLYDWANQAVEPLSDWPPNKMCWIKTQSYM